MEAFKIVCLCALGIIALPFAFWLAWVVLGLIWSLLVMVIMAVFGMLGAIFYVIHSGVQRLFSKK